MGRDLCTYSCQGFKSNFIAGVLACSFQHCSGAGEVAPAFVGAQHYEGKVLACLRFDYVGSNGWG